MVFFLVGDEAQAVPFCNRTVRRAPFRDVLPDVSADIPLYERVSIFTLFLPLCFILPTLVPPFSIPQVRLFSLQSSIAGCLPCQVPLALAAENLPPRQAGERIFRVLLARACHQSTGQKNNQPSVLKCIGGKQKNNLKN